MSKPIDKKHEHVHKIEKESKTSTIRFKTMDELNNRVLDLSEAERQKQDTAKEISDTLQYFIDKQNIHAKGYLHNFRSRVNEKIDHKIRRKYFGSKPKEEILPKIYKDENINQKRKDYKHEIKKIEDEESNKKHFHPKVGYEKRNGDKIIEGKKSKLKRQIYAAIKRVFNKEITTHRGPDIDNAAGLFLLKLSRFFKDEKNGDIDIVQKAVASEERGKKGLQYDSGGTRDGLDIVNIKKKHQEGPNKGKEYISLFNALAILDEHNKTDGMKNMITPGKNVIKPTSSTHIIFDLLKTLNVIDVKYLPQIKRFVDFVDKVDSNYYQFAGSDKEVSHKTLFGLNRQIPIRKIYEYFENPKHTGFEVLKNEEIEALEPKRGQKEVEENINSKIEERQKLEREGKFGKFNNASFVFALGDEFKGGQSMSAHIGDIGTFKIHDSGDLYMYSPQPLPEKICGLPTNKHFLHIKNISLEDLDNLFDVFEFGRDADPNLRKNFLNYRKEQIERQKKKIIQEKNTEKNLKNNPYKLLKTEKKIDFKVGKTYEGMINNISNKIAYVTLNTTGTINGRIRVEDKNELKKYTIGDLIKVRIEEVSQEEKKLITLSLIPAK